MHNQKSIPFLIFSLSLIFYLYTLSPSLAWGDGVRLQSEAISGESFILSELAGNGFSPDPLPFSKVGITAWDHPLYIVIGHSLVKAFPSLDPLWLVNLISAIFGAAAITLVFLLSYQYTSSLVASILAALALAVSHTFWWHSTTPEVYTLFAFLLLAGLYCFERFERTGRVSALTASAFFLGLAASNHVLAVLAAPALGLYFLLSRPWRQIRIPDWRKLIPPLLGFVAGFSLFIIQFIRMARSFSLSEVLGPVVGSTFLNGLGAFSPPVIVESLSTYLLYLFVQFGPLGILFGAFGIRKAFDRSDPSLRMVFSLYVVYTTFGIFYRVTDQFAFFLMSHVFFALLIGLGAAGFLAIPRTGTRFALTSVLFLTILALPALYRAIPQLAKDNGIGDSLLKIPQIGTGLRDGLAYYIDPNKRRDYAAFAFGTRTMAGLPPGSLVIAEWYTDTDEYFILRYYSKVEELRPDVSVVGWPTEDPFSFDSRLAVGLIEDSFPDRPVYLASLSERFYAASRLIEAYCILPENNLYRLYHRDSNIRPCLGKDAVME